jgi:hypothetical protein
VDAREEVARPVCAQCVEPIALDDERAELGFACAALGGVARVEGASLGGVATALLIQSLSQSVTRARARARGGARARESTTLFSARGAIIAVAYAHRIELRLLARDERTMRGP